MPDDDDKQEEPKVDLSKLSTLLTDVSKVDEKTGKQLNTTAVIIAVIVLCVVIAGVGISLAIARRKAVKAQYEADKAREGAVRAEADAKQAELAAERARLESEAERRSGLAYELEAEADRVRKEYEDLSIELAAATSWTDIKVREP